MNRRLHKALLNDPEDSLDVTDDDIQEYEADDIPPLASAGVEELRNRLETNPEETVDLLQDVIDEDLTPEKTHRIIERLGEVAQDPEGTAEAIEASTRLNAVEGPDEFAQGEAFDDNGVEPPEGEDWSEWYTRNFIVERYRTSTIKINPNNKKFDDDNLPGILGWIIFNGPKALGPVDPVDFRSQSAGKSYIYPLETLGEGPLRVALFADYGTGLAHSRYIARQIEIDEPEYAIHLGDVYYTGTRKEFDKYFHKPLEGMLQKQKTKLFLLCDNHEGYSGFGAYYDYLDSLKNDYGGFQQQDGSYFCLRNDNIQIVGLDTIYAGKGKLRQEEKDWLINDVFGPNPDLPTIILTGRGPYKHGKSELTDLYTEELQPILAGKNIKLWFWGNNHYAALFEHGPATPFHGSCIGHGGYPYRRLKQKDPASHPAPVIWEELGSRYTGSRKRLDKGLNGFCTLEIEANSFTAKYVDWRGHTRLRFQFPL